MQLYVTSIQLYVTNIQLYVTNIQLYVTNIQVMLRSLQMLLKYNRLTLVTFVVRAAGTQRALRKPPGILILLNTGKLQEMLTQI